MIIKVELYGVITKDITLHLPVLVTSSKVSGYPKHFIKLLQHLLLSVYSLRLKEALLIKVHDQNLNSN